METVEILTSCVPPCQVKSMMVVTLALVPMRRSRGGRSDWVRPLSRCAVVPMFLLCPLVLIAICSQVYAEATLVFPLIVAQTFMKNWTPRDEPAPSVVAAMAAAQLTEEKTEEAKVEVPQEDAAKQQSLWEALDDEGVVSVENEKVQVHASRLISGKLLRRLAAKVKTVLSVRQCVFSSSSCISS